MGAWVYVSVMYKQISAQTSLFNADKKLTNVVSE